jgi:hypothetical protein
MIKVLPLILSWGVSLTRNASIFKDKLFSLERVAIQGLGILSHFPHVKVDPLIRTIQDVNVDYSSPWDFFDGASQNNYQQCGGCSFFIYLKITSLSLKWD